MIIRGVIFDLDGTLLDTILDLANSTNAALQRHGYREHPVEAYKQFLGDGLEMLIRRAVDMNLSEIIVKKVMADVNQEYAKHWNNTTKPYDGIYELLDRLEEKNIKISVFSNKVHEFTTKMIHHYFPNTSFTTIAGLQEDIPRKPDPYGGFIIAQSMKLKPEDIVMIGDSVVDMQFAQRCGMFGIAVSWGYGAPALLYEHTKSVVHKPLDIISLIEDALRL